MINSILIQIITGLRSRIFRFSEFLGVHVTPVHFYSPIPNTRDIDDEIFLKQNDCIGLNFNDDMQFGFLKKIVPKFQEEFQPSKNSGLSLIDGFILYALIREKKPSLFIEIGSGYSTLISLEALKKNEDEGYAYNFIGVEPYPRKVVKDIANPAFRLIEEKVQNVDVLEFADADFLFIDSSHVSKIGSDVNYEILSIIPRLKVGAFIHWHDIMIPGEYPKGWIEDGNKFWNESYMVHSFMLFNNSFRVVWAAKYMQVMHPDQLSKYFSNFSPHDPNQQLSSFWIERIS